jgi:hypothetical protein
VTPEQLLENLEAGRAVWMSVRGSSMRPLLRGDEELRVVRCTANDVAKGDIAILQREDEGLVAHLVVGARPLRTASFSGVPDPEGFTLLGRATGVRLGRLHFDVGGRGRLAIYAMHLAWRRLVGSPAARAGYRSIVDTLTSDRTQKLRRRALDRIDVRPVTVHEFQRAMRFSSRFETAPPGVLERAFNDGLLVCAWSRARVVGIVLLDHHGVVRHSQVAAIAVGLGVEERLVFALSAAAQGAGRLIEGVDSSPAFTAAVQPIIQHQPGVTPRSLRPEDVLRVRPDVVLHRSGEHLIALSNDDRLHTFADTDGSASEVGVRIAELIDGQRDVRGIVDVICEEFDVDRVTCEADTLDYLAMLFERRVVAFEGAVTPPAR